jgi:hypothetical protein
VNKKADREKLWQLRSMAIDLKEDGATFAEIESVLARVVAKEGFDPPLARKTALDLASGIHGRKSANAPPTSDRDRLLGFGKAIYRGRKLS